MFCKNSRQEVCISIIKIQPSLNAIAHKDYGCNAPIQISVHDSQLYIWNEGRLPEDWTIDDLLKKHGSRPYNPLIANGFFRAGLVEAWGRGIEKVVNECIDHGCPKPVFDYRGSGLMVEFKAKARSSTDEMRQEKLSTTEQEILRIINNDPSATTRNIAENLGVFKSTITRNIAKLKDKGILKRIGSTKKGQWIINDDY